MLVYPITKAKSAGFSLTKTNFNVLYDTFRIDASNKIKIKSSLEHIGHHIHDEINMNNDVVDAQFSIFKTGSIFVSDTVRNHHSIRRLDVTLSVTKSLSEVLPESVFTCNFVTDIARDIGTTKSTSISQYPLVNKSDISRMDVAIGTLLYTDQTEVISIIPTCTHGVIPVTMWAQINHLSKYIRIILQHIVNNKHYRTTHLVQYIDEIYVDKSSGSKLNCQLKFSINYRLY